MCVCMCIYIYIYVHIHIITNNMNNIYLGPSKRGGIANLRFIIFLDFPYIKTCLLVWDSGLQPIYDNSRENQGNCKL